LWESRTPPDFFCNTSNTREPLTIRGQGFSAFGG
jgi:hypothetical protein